MVGIGGQVQPTIGNVDPNTVLASGVVISGVVNLVNIAPTTVTAGTVNVTTALTVSGGTNLQNVTGFLWKGTLLTSGHGSTSGSAMGGIIVSGRVLHSENGFMRMDLSGQSIWVPYWISS